MPRISDEVLTEIINHDGFRKGSDKPINELGVVRLALDLQRLEPRSKG